MSSSTSGISTLPCSLEPRLLILLSFLPLLTSSMMFAKKASTFIYFSFYSKFRKFQTLQNTAEGNRQMLTQSRIVNFARGSNL